MGTVSGAKGVVDIDLSQAGELLSETGFVLFLLGEEANVLQENNITLGHGTNLASASAPMRLSVFATGLPSNSPRQAATGVKRML